MADMSPASSLGPPTAKSTITPQQAKYIANIKTALSNNSLTVVVGAGVSINAIYGSRRISGDDLKRVVESMSWLGLLLHGLDYLREEELLSDPDDEKERVGHIRILRPQSPTSAPTEDKLRAAASFLKRKLTECNKLDNWFDLEFEGIYQKCINHDPNPILDALKDLYLCGARIITTNYDDLLEKHIGADRIVIDNTPASKMFFAKRNLGILHVHGVWWYSTGTVLDDMDYRRTTEDEVLQQNLKNSLSASEVLLFVGTGAGLSDPNFGNLLAWAAKQNDGLAQRNCVLARREEKVDTNLNNLNILWYGQNHEDLPMFLNELASSCKPSTKKRRASTSTVPRDRDRDRGSAIKMVEKYAEDARKDLEMRQSDMEKRKLVPGDFNWFTKLPEYLTWRSAGSTELLWYVDKPGSGKTTVFQNIVVKLLDRQWHSREVDVAYVFCPESTSAEPSESHILPAAILRSIIGQLLARGDSRITELLKLLYGDYDRITMVLKLSNVDNDRITMVLNSGKTLDNLLGSHDTTPGILWGLLRLVIEATLDKETLIVIDGIDKIKAEDQLEFLKSLLMLRQGLPLKSVTKFLISSRPCAKIQDILKGVPSIDENIERRHCLNSLFFSELHARRDRVSDPQIDTDQWIWEHHAYRKWLEKRSSILWIQGKPGSGKSTLMRMIQKTLLSKSKASLNESQTGMRDSIVADFFYSARGVSNETSHRLMLQSLLYQVLEQEPYVFKVFKCQFRRLLGESTGRVEWPYDDLKTILLSLPHSNILDKPWTSRCKIYFLLDAMDESEYGLRRIEVLSLLSGLCSTSGEIIIKIIIASRPANEIEKKLKGFHHIELQKENAADIEKVVDAGLRLMWESMNENDDDSQTSSDGNESGGDSDSSSDRDDLPAKISREASGQQDQSSRIAVGVSNDDMNDTIYQEALEFVGKYLIQSADGVILWVVLILGELLRYVEKGSHSRNEIKEKLEDLPTDLVSIYKEIVDTLQKGHNEKEMAQGRLMLTWGSFAKRPLTVKELRDVIAIPAGAQSIFRWSTSILHDNRISIQHNNWAPIRSRMVDMCGGFLEAVPPNSESSIKIHSKTRKMKSTYVVQLLHQTVKDFLLHNNSAIPFNLDETDCQCLIAAALLRYLTLSLPMENLQTKLIQEWDQEEYREFVEYLLDRPLLGYVLAFLPQHIRDSGVNVTGLELTRFLQQLRCKPEHHAWAFLDGWCCVELLPSAPSTTSPLAESFRTGCLMAASEAGHTEIVRVMVDLMGKNANCKTALHGAASNGHEAVVRLLLEKGSVVEAKGKGGGTALHEAASNRHETVVRLLLEKGANIEAKDNDGKTALHWAARNGHEAVVRVLLEHKADVDAQGGTESYVQTALYWAARNGHEAVVHLLLKANAKVDTRVGFNGWTALCEAADVGHVAVVQLLLEANADVDAKGGPYKWTALHQAADNGHEAVVRLLLEANAEVDAKGGFNGWTALCGASRNGHETVVRLLLEAKADVGAKEGFYGQTALHRAAWNGHEAVVWLLLKAKADVDAMEGFYRWTPLHWAAWNGHEAVVRLLLEAEAEVDTKGEFNGWTALHWAARNGHEAVVRLLLEFKADVDTKDNNGETALYWAARSGHEAVVRLL